MEAQMNAITDVHFLILKDLLALSTSAYTEVGVSITSSSYIVIVPSIAGPF